MGITFDQILSSYRPRKAIEEQYNASAGGAVTGLRDICILAEGLAAGTGSANEVSDYFADADAGVAFFGSGSFGAFMVRQAYRGGKLKGRVRGCFLTEPAGVAATGKVNFTTASTSSGTFSFNIAGALVVFSVESGTSVVDIAAAMVTAFNELDVDAAPPCTAASAIQGAGPSYTATFTMGNKGVIGNFAPTYQIVTGLEPSGTTVLVDGVCFGLNTNTLGSVAGTLYPTLTTALSNLSTVETPILVHAGFETPDGSTKNADLLLAHINTKCDGEHMMRGCVVTCLCTTVALSVSWVAALDDSDAERYRTASIPLNPATASPGTWSMAMACYVANAIAQQLDPAYPFANVALPYAIAPPASGDVLTNDEIDTLIEGAVTPIQYDVKRQRNVLVIGIGSRLFSGKPQPWAVVDTTDYYRDLLLDNLEMAFPAGTKLAEDGETNLDENTVTPSGVLDVVHDTIFSEALRGKLRNREALWASAAAEIDAVREGQVNFSVEHAVMMGLYVIAGKLRQRGGIIGQAAA